MKKIIRSLVHAIVKALSALVSPVARPLAFVTRLSMVRARLIMAQPSFYARVKSSLTIPEPFYGGTQGGYTQVVNLLIAAVVAIVGIIIVFAYLIPQAYISSGNMSTALTNAGAAPQSIQWFTWLMWGGIILVVIGVVLALVRGSKRKG